MEIANVFPRPISSMNHPQILIVRSLSTAKYLKFSVYLKTNMFSKGFLVHIGNCKTLLWGWTYPVAVGGRALHPWWQDGTIWKAFVRVKVDRLNIFNRCRLEWGMRANDCRSLQKCLRNFWTALYQFLKQEHFSRLFWTLWRLKIPKCTNQETLKHECCRPFGEIILCCDTNPLMQYWHWEELQNRVARKNAKESPLFLSITTCC